MKVSRTANSRNHGKSVTANPALLRAAGFCLILKLAGVILGEHKK
jgi:hypothetical protein